MIIGKHEDDVGPFASYSTWEQKDSKAAKGEEGMVHDGLQHSRPCRFGQAWRALSLWTGRKFCHSTGCMVTGEAPGDMIRKWRIVR
ncbi:MAG: hypothetical protein CMP29_10410 [Roseibacillus sp.]|nr:hypothetical protein [Roseibacillus sp.]|tara:strand:+ start:92 stop:349 length:258 start_codon:yes stop_codon:yes gene_type:complete